MSKILVIGDVMLDKYSYGSVKRLNPEWPNPLLTIDHEEYRLGWAANVACNISFLMGDADLIGVVGHDSYCNTFSSLCKEVHISFLPIFSSTPTITKQRFIETTYQQQLLRVDYEKKNFMSPNDNKLIVSHLNQLAPEYIVISDYNKGMINQELVDAIKKYALDTQAKILVDTKPASLDYFKDVYLLKPNFKEFCMMVDSPDLENTDEAIKWVGVPFVKDYRFNLVVTRWNKWAVLITQEGEFYSLPTQAKQVFDVTGAWDTFLAAIVCSLVLGSSLVDAVELGNKASWIVVGKQGTVSITSQELGL